jgi:hypothetical protein
MMRGLVALVVLAVAATAGAQPPSRDVAKPASPSGSAVVRGRVVAMSSGEPLRRATVVIESAGAKLARTVQTDLDGRFEFQHLAAGKLKLSASKTGFIPLDYGQRRSFQSGRDIDLAAGQVLDNLEIALPRAGAITGRVLNDLGEPAPGIIVIAVRQRFSNGRRALTIVGRSKETDDLGEYRLSELPPGSYFVFTSRPRLAEVGTAPEEQIVSASTYYPSAPSGEFARSVAVKSGQEVRGIDITQIAVRPVTISGTLLDANGRVATEGSITIRSYVEDGFTLGSNQTFGMGLTSGTFALKNVVAGRYMVMGTPTARDAAPGKASAQVTVGETDIDGIVLQAVQAATVSGRISVVDGASRPPFTPASLRFAALGESDPIAGSTSGKADWTFSIANLSPGRVRLALRDPLPDGWGVKSIVVGDTDVEMSAVDVAPGATIAADVTLTDRVTSVAGRVTTTQKERLADHTVLVFSADPTHWIYGARSYAVARPDQAGRYRVQGLRPGPYLAIALEYLDDGEEANPDVLRWAKDRATPVDLVEGEPVSLDLALVRYEGGL